MIVRINNCKLDFVPMSESGETTDPVLRTNGHTTPLAEVPDDSYEEQEQEEGSQTTEEEMPPQEGSVVPGAPPSAPSPPAPTPPPPYQSASASANANSRPKPQYKLKYTMAGVFLAASDHV